MTRAGLTGCHSLVAEIPGRIRKFLYILLMYTGLRALFNLWRERCCDDGGPTGQISGTAVDSEPLGKFDVFVHRRPAPIDATPNVRFGMISVRQRRSSINRWLYHYLLLTSHFGCGHLEVAYYETDDFVVFYGIRNILKSNVDRLGLRTVGDKLRLATHGENILVLQELASLLAMRELTTSFATGRECVRLAVRAELLNPQSQDLILSNLEKKYDRLHDRFSHSGLSLTESWRVSPAARFVADRFTRNESST